MLPRRQRIDDAIRADVAGLFVEDRQSGDELRRDEQRCDVEVLAAERLQGAVERRHDRRHDDPRDVARRHVVELKQVARQDAELVHRAGTISRESPVDSQFLAAPVLKDDQGNPLDDTHLLQPGFAFSIDTSVGTAYYTLDGTDPRAPGGEIQGKAYSGPIPVNETNPRTVASPCTCASRSKSPSRQPACAWATFWSVSTHTPRISDMSSIRAPSTVARPAML